MPSPSSLYTESTVTLDEEDAADPQDRRSSLTADPPSAPTKVPLVPPASAAEAVAVAPGAVELLEEERFLCASRESGISAGGGAGAV